MTSVLKLHLSPLARSCLTGFAEAGLLAVVAQAAPRIEIVRA